MPPLPVSREHTTLLARAASAIHAVKTDGLHPADAIAFTVWPTALMLAAEATLPFTTLESRVKASRTVYRKRRLA